MKTAGDILNDKGKDIIFVNENSSIAEAIQVMVENKIGAILVKQGNEFVGIWTERDLLRLSMNPDFNTKTTLIKNVMTTNLKWANADDSVYQLMDKFLGLRLRHLLIKDGSNCVGMISAGDALKETLNQKNRELKELNSMFSWEYYENWRWK